MGVFTFKHHEEPKSSDKTVVFFTGFRTEDDEKYEWWSFKDLPVNVILVRDISCTWYHAPYDEVCEYLRRKVTRKCLMVGGSSGGYAAIVFANALGCDSLSFNPQTQLYTDECPVKNKKWGDRHKQIEKITKNPELLDISWIKGQHHELHYSSRNPLDVYYAERMDVKLVPFKSKEHGLSEVYQKAGVLRQIIDRRIKEL